jgi:glycosyltransferase involved in cell wall biosynthesis
VNSNRIACADPTPHGGQLAAATTPTISVILPTFNRVLTVGRAIDSVLAQSFGELEVIVIDDGSTDATLELIQAYQDPRLTLLAHERNRGAAAARNTGAAAARGDWLAFLDSDDVWHPDKLALQLEHLQAAGPDARASCTGYEVDSPPDRWQLIPAPVTRDRLLLWCDLSPGSTLMVARDLFQSVGPFDESWPRYEDWDWLLRCEARARILVVPAALATIHYTAKRPAAAVEDAARAFIARYGDELRAHGRLGRRALGLRWLELARYQAMERRPGPFLRNMVRAFRAYPFHSPGSLVLILDAWLGTRLEARARRAKAWLSARHSDSNRSRDGTAG